MKTLAALVFFLATGFISASEISTTYLVYASSVTGGQITALRGFGYSRNDQPIKITNIVQPANTNYIMVTVTSRTTTENTTLTGHETTGRAQRVQTIEIISEYDGRLGGVVTSAKVEDCKTSPGLFVCLPRDIDRDWTRVEISSE